MGKGVKSSTNRGVSFMKGSRGVTLLFYFIPWLIMF